MGKKVKVVLDTNILISALGFGGKPREILQLVLEKKLQAISSPILLAEFEDVISKKFPKLAPHLEKINRQLKKYIILVKPKITVNLVRDDPDNRVLEAALEGNCEYIITGDTDLLQLKIFKNISILKPADFLSNIKY